VVANTAHQTDIVLTSMLRLGFMSVESFVVRCSTLAPENEIHSDILSLQQNRNFGYETRITPGVECYASSNEDVHSFHCQAGRNFVTVAFLRKRQSLIRSMLK